MIDFNTEPLPSSHRGQVRELRPAATEKDYFLPGAGAAPTLENTKLS
jgi:hypothetical protein